MNDENQNDFGGDYSSPLWNIAAYKIKNCEWRNRKEILMKSRSNNKKDESENEEEYERNLTREKLIEFYTDEIFLDEFQDDIYQLHQDIKNILEGSLGCVYDKESYCDFFDFIKYNSIYYYQIKRKLDKK